MKEGKDIADISQADSPAGGGLSPGQGLRNAFGFFTILPVSGGTLREAADAVWLLPVVAVTLGAAEGLAAWGLSYIAGPLVTAAIVLSLALVLTGFHHADGLADTGDALMARGSASRRLEVLKDRTLGMGAVGAMLLTYLVSWSAMAEAAAALTVRKIIVALIVVEVAARLSLMLTGWLTPSSHEGSGSVFIGTLRGRRGAAGIALSLAALIAAAPLIPWVSLFAGLSAVATAAIVSLIARRLFGGAGGDLLGASVEWGRMAALIAVSVSLTFM